MVFNKKSIVLLILVSIVMVGLMLSGCGAKDSQPAPSGGDQAVQDDFPNKPITYVQHNEPGSGGDINARTVARLAEYYLGVPINFVTRPGGNGADAINFAFRQPRDGYTIMHWTASHSGYFNMPGYPATADDFDYIINFLDVAYILAVNTSSPIQNIEEFVQYARENPGAISISGSRIGSIHHQNLFALTAEADIDVTYVPQQGGAAALAAALGGHVTGLVYRPADMLEYVKDGSLRPLVIFDTKRDPEYPDTPTIAEAGFEMQPLLQKNGLMIPKGVPENRKQIIYDAFYKAMDEPEWQDFLEQTSQADGRTSSEEMTEMFLKEVEFANHYLKEIGVIQ